MFIHDSFFIVRSLGQHQILYEGERVTEKERERRREEGRMSETERMRRSESGRERGREISFIIVHCECYKEILVIYRLQMLVVELLYLNVKIARENENGCRQGERE